MCLLVQLVLVYLKGSDEEGRTKERGEVGCCRNVAGFGWWVVVTKTTSGFECRGGAGLLPVKMISSLPSASFPPAAVNERLSGRTAAGRCSRSSSLSLSDNTITGADFCVFWTDVISFNARAILKVLISAQRNVTRQTTSECQSL